MELFGKRKHRTGAEQSSRLPHLSGDPLASLLATYDPDADLGPEGAADLGAKLRAMQEDNERRGVIDGRLYPMLRKLEAEAGLVRGRHYTEWIPTLDELRSSGDDDTALTLLWECIQAAERAARVAGTSPAPGYTKRAAVIYRRRKDYAREIEVMERWEAAAPPGYRGAMADRLAVARKLQEKQQA